MLPPNAGRVCLRSWVSGSNAELGAVSRQTGQNPRGHAGQEGPANDGAAAQEYLRLLLQQDLGYQVSLHVLIKIPDSGVVDHPYFIHAVGQKLIRHGARVFPHQDGVDGGGPLLCKLPSSPDDLRDNGGDLAAPVLGENRYARVLADVLALERPAGDDDGVVALARLHAGAAERALAEVYDRGVSVSLALDQRSRERNCLKGA